MAGGGYITTGSGWRGATTLLGCLVWACACSSTTAVPEAGCHLNSDCVSPLICALGACRKECMTAADCISFGAGSSCVNDNNGNAVCQPAAELNMPCDNEGECPAPLACASDYRCRNLCSSDAACNVYGITGRVCATDANGVHYCADPGAATNGVITDPPPVGAPDAAVVEPSVADSGTAPAAEGGAASNADATTGAGCDLANPNSCPGPGMGCEAIDQGGGTGTSACQSVGTGMQGATCMQGTDCAPSFGCDPTDMMCEQYCRADMCPYGTLCQTCPPGHQACDAVGALYNGINYGECH